MKALGYITLSEAERISGIKADTLKKRCQEGVIVGAVKQGKTWFIPRNQVVSEQDSPADDRILSLIATFAEAGVGTGITLFMGGSLVIGNLIPTKAYLERLKIKLKTSPQKESIPEKVFESFDFLFDSMMKNLPKDTKEVMDKQISAIHLDKVEYQVGGIWQSPPDTVMRIKLNAIDGFMWGRPDNIQQD